MRVQKQKFEIGGNTQNWRHMAVPSMAESTVSICAIRKKHLSGAGGDCGQVELLVSLAQGRTAGETEAESGLDFGLEVLDCHLGQIANRFRRVHELATGIRSHHQPCRNCLHF